MLNAISPTPPFMSLPSTLAHTYLVSTYSSTYLPLANPTPNPTSRSLNQLKESKSSPPNDISTSPPLGEDSRGANPMFSTSRQNHVNQNSTPCARDKVDPVTLRRNMSGLETTREREEAGGDALELWSPLFFQCIFFLASIFSPGDLFCRFAFLLCFYTNARGDMGRVLW